jgi:hypothetical protein
MKALRPTVTALSEPLTIGTDRHDGIVNFSITGIDNIATLVS